MEKRLIKKLDTIFSMYIRMRDNQRCIICATTENLTCGHLFTRGAKSTRWDEDVCFAQCMSCNFRHEAFPEPFKSFYISKFGKGKYDALVFKHKQPKKFTKLDIVGLIDKYQTKLYLLQHPDKQLI